MNRTKPFRTELVWCLALFIMAFSACALPNRIVWNEQIKCIKSRNNIRYITLSTSSTEYNLKVLDKKNVCLSDPLLTYTSEVSYDEEKKLKYLTEDKPILDLLKQGEQVEMKIYSGYDQPAFKVLWKYDK